MSLTEIVLHVIAAIYRWSQIVSLASKWHFAEAPNKSIWDGHLELFLSMFLLIRHLKEKIVEPLVDISLNAKLSKNVL